MEWIVSCRIGHKITMVRPSITFSVVAIAQAHAQSEGSIYINCPVLGVGRNLVHHRPNGRGKCIGELVLSQIIRFFGLNIFRAVTTLDKFFAASLCSTWWHCILHLKLSSKQLIDAVHCFLRDVLSDHTSICHPRKEDSSHMFALKSDDAFVEALVQSSIALATKRKYDAY
jgi:hypothetical protein